MSAADYWIPTGRGSVAFTGELKVSADDFAVDEIRPDGTVAEAPAEAEAPEVPKLPAFARTFLEWQKDPGSAEGALCPDPAPLAEIVGDDAAGQIAAFAAGADAAAGAAVELGTIEDKGKRRLLNTSLRAAHPSLRMESAGGAVRVVRCEAYPAMVAAFGEPAAQQVIAFANGASRTPLQLRYATSDKEVKRRVNRELGVRFGALQMRAVDGVVTVGKKLPKRSRCQIDQPHTHFTLWKKDMGWFEAVRILSQHLGCREGEVCCAGLKDKKAVTTQRASVRGVHGVALAKLRHDRLRVTGISYEPEQLWTGSLAGNRFSVVVRHLKRVDPSAPGLRALCEAVFADGFPNAFGPQRFSHAARLDRHAGGCLARGDVREALAALMTPTDDDNPDTAAAKRTYPSDDPAATARALPPSRTAERDMLFAKARYPDDPVKWVRAVPYSVRELWLHSMQSWVWNKVLSLRLARHGRAVLRGDLLLPPHSVAAPTEKAVPVVCEEPEKHSIFEVVMPKPGAPEAAGTLYPANETADLFDEVLAEYGLARHGWDVEAAKVKLTPTYRHVFARPENAAAEVTDDETTLRVQFNLPSSAYATVCIGTMLGSVIH